MIVNVISIFSMLKKAILTYVQQSIWLNVVVFYYADWIFL